MKHDITTIFVMVIGYQFFVGQRFGVPWYATIGFLMGVGIAIGIIETGEFIYRRIKKRRNKNG